MNGGGKKTSKNQTKMMQLLQTTMRQALYKEKEPMNLLSGHLDTHWTFVRLKDITVRLAEGACTT